MRDDVIDFSFELRRPGFTLAVGAELPGRGLTVIWGPSGCGKTTLLRCMAGLEIARGWLRVNGQTWQDEAYVMPPHFRPLGYVFQDGQLFPHLDVRSNLHYGVPCRPTAQVDLPAVIQLLGIGHLLNRAPVDLSGGERQRVAIARALARQPKLLLMDEPLSALDSARKREILPYLEQLRKTLAIPVLYVTHVPSEVEQLADHVLSLDQGAVGACEPMVSARLRIDFQSH